MSVSLFSKKALGIGAALLVAAVLVAWAVQYILNGRYLVGTDDAYIAANSSLIAAKVSGYVATVDVRQDETVKQGQLLVTIDARDYRIAANEADAAVADAHAALALQQYKIKAAAATLQQDKAREKFAAKNAQRYASLTKSGASTRQQEEQAKTDLATIRAQLDADTASLEGAKAQVDVLRAGLNRASAQAAQAHLNLLHTQIRAPFGGVVGNKTVAVGDYLRPGAQIMAVVPLARVYVIANYKETQITNIRPGQKVSLNVDAYPGMKVTGHVGSIYPASGQEFALLPPDNATGNFTKIVQRVPVKILLNLTPALIGKLRPGMSVEPEIDTRP